MSDESSNKKSLEQNTPPAKEGDVYAQYKKDVLAEEWQDIFSDLDVDDKEYKIFLSASQKMDDPHPIMILLSPKK